MSLRGYISDILCRGRVNTRTCIIVSKLNAVPFHRVNSPLVEPVSRRLPSGVHFTTLTGWRILFRDECKCLAGTESTALPLRAGGRSIYESGQHTSFDCIVYLSRHRAQTHVYHVTSTGSLHLESHSPFVLRPAIVYILCHVRAVIRSRTWFVYQCMFEVCDSTNSKRDVMKMDGGYVRRESLVLLVKPSWPPA